MVFVDQAQLTVKAGDGGRGCSAFAQPPYTRYPYPDGGDGGDGGDVIIRADPNIATLLDFRFRHIFKAGRGGHGGGNKKTGKGGQDCVICVPAGTVVFDAATKGLLRDLTASGDEMVVAVGGRGGLGNATADEATPGTSGEERQLLLELKLIADVGIAGLPNAGKSSLLSRISTARPKIGAYPFTTRYPVLGVVSVDGIGPACLSAATPVAGQAGAAGAAGRSFVACDIPGLMEGAHEGRGLGMQFLRHIERTRLLVHLIDMAGVDGRDPVEAYHQLNHELAAYSPMLKAKPQLIVANKMDLPQARDHLKAFERAVGGKVWPISCATGAGIADLIRVLWNALSMASAHA